MKLNKGRLVVSDFTDRARAEAQTRRDPGGKPCRGWHSRSDAHDKGFVSGAWWAAERDLSDAEVEAGARAAMENWREQTPTGMFLPDWYGTDEEDRQQWRAFIRSALIAARDARKGSTDE